MSEETYKKWLEAAKANPEKAKDVLKQAKADAAAATAVAAR